MDKILISFCRYYKGQDKDPYTNDQEKSFMWVLEKGWVECYQSDEGKERLASYINDYSNDGLSQFEMRDNTPASLKAYLYNRFQQWNEGDGFEQWYTDIYRRSKE